MFAMSFFEDDEGNQAAIFAETLAGVRDLGGHRRALPVDAEGLAGVRDRLLVEFRPCLA